MFIFYFMKKSTKNLNELSDKHYWSIFKSILLLASWVNKDRCLTDCSDLWFWVWFRSASFHHFGRHSPWSDRCLTNPKRIFWFFQLPQGADCDTFILLCGGDVVCQLLTWPGLMLSTLGVSNIFGTLICVFSVTNICASDCWLLPFFFVLFFLLKSNQG